MTFVARIRRLPSIAFAAFALAALATALLGAAPAAAKPSESCARAIVNDWYGDGKVDKIYDEHCYREAIRSLPVDVRDYSNAEEDILRALAYAKKGEPDPGPAGGKPGGGGNNPTKGPTGHGGPTDPGDTTGLTDTGDGGDTVAAPDTDTSGPSSIPLPLIVLGGLAFLLLVAGGAGYVNRRMQTPGADDQSDE